ncbi:MAG: FtsW/RodA/SpoVE family cell cycle protein [Solirubrobacteraceae bacterium]
MSTLSPIKESEQTARERSVSGFSLPLDPLLTLAAIGLGICSIVTLKAATVENPTGNPAYYYERQIVYLVLGFVVMAAVARLDYRWLKQFRRGIYSFLILAILAVLALGSPVGGSTRAISLPLFSFQSSEIGKVLLIVFLAAFLTERARSLRDRDTTIKTLALALVPTILVFKEPDIGSGLVYLAIALCILFVAGVPWRHIATIFVAAVLVLVVVLAVGPALGFHVLSRYQMQRLTGFLHPNTVTNTSHGAYQQLQAKIAVGSGRQVGLPKPSTSDFTYLPEHETDFVFASLSLEHGFVGGALVLSLYALLIWRSLRILTMAKDLFGSLIAAGVAAMLMVQVFVNVGVATGILPVTGITLPLMSYGGSSVLTTMLSLGLLQSIYLRARCADSLKGRVLRW